MADIQARREARRRKILENAENRMRRINNLQRTPEQVPKPNLDLSNETATVSRLECVSESDFIIEDTETEIRSVFPNSYENVTEVKRNKLVNQIWIVVGLAVVIYYFNLVLEVCSAFCVDVAAYRVNKIFVPLMFYEVFKLTFVKPSVHNNSLLNAFLTLNNVNVAYTNKVLYIFQLISNILMDVAVYFCVFVLTDFITRLFR